MHLLAFVDNPDHVCCRYRLRAFEPALRAAGHTLRYHQHPRSWSEALFAKLPAADGCILQRRLPGAWELRRLRRRYPLLIFDSDDAVWLRDSHSPRGLHSLRRLRRFRAVVAAADRVIAGNAFLAEQAARFTQPDRVTVIPTCVDPAIYPCSLHAGRATRLVWIGSSSTLKGLEHIRPTLEQIGRDVSGVRLRLICDRFLTFDHLPVEERPWSERTEASALATSDIGLAWMPDDDWSRGKCGLKVLQYMAAGLPVIANPVGVHRAIVRHGDTGLLAQAPGEWVEAVRTLAADAALRVRLGEAGRALVAREFSVDCGARLWVESLSRCASPRIAA